jgi:hypothetical protein
MARNTLLAFGIALVILSALSHAAEPPTSPSKPEHGNDARGVRDLKEVSDSNLQMLMIALHDYNNVHDHFPPAVVLGPDGKTPHSWRVEILPFIEGPILERLGRPSHPYKDLYERYKLSEPWDGPSNKQLLAQMPDIFRSPTDPPRSTDTIYFALVGKGAIFDGPKGTPIADINDGTFHTILLVESKPSVPWTKPVDIAEKPLPKLGGLYASGFSAVDAGGTRHLIPGDIREAHLRALITRDGKELGFDFTPGWKLYTRP